MTRTTDVTLHSVLKFSDFLSEERAKEVTDSTQFMGGKWKELCRQTNFSPNIAKYIIPVDIGYANFLVLTEVPAGAVTKAHAHDEPMFRYVLSGSLELNNRSYEAGDWVYVPKNVPYEITTKTGYSTLSGYGQACVEPPT
ncbi:cupin domain-containing protein [Labrys sp. KNU-23]|uniref:cupin domain-containing protein n=1 Tax=Labrys sp. KNU-23 TaxID=2789216 RepID=UPI0011EC6DA4|nr:cupin domain-containing protein [Labrys sp. KNU-23]QEN87714.1 cupin domain-containing protein [Labrys sp. KNU-23]